MTRSRRDTGADLPDGRIPDQPGPDDGVGRLAKLDLHVHQERSARIEQVVAMSDGSTATNWRSWVDDLLAVEPEGIARLEALWASRPAPFDLDREPSILTARLRRVMEEAAADGAALVEVRVGNETLLHPDFLRCFREAERAVRTANPKFFAEPVVTFKLWHDRAELDRVLDVCLEQAGSEIHGIDLLNMPYDAPADWTAATTICGRAAEAGLGVTAHIGEVSSADIAAVLELPGLVRIGHGVHAADDADLVARLLDLEIVVECCLTSNLVMGVVDSASDHPIARFLDCGVGVVLGTDDPVELATSIGREYALAQEVGLTIDDLSAISDRAVRVAFTSDARRAALRNVMVTGR